ncbi:MAG: hydrogenase maturation protease [Deltaproteobacteria bacterium]|nr:hydrogenase maturation protease [Deltaproteobacteria bacterium]
MCEQKKFLVLGIGNPILSDDAIGIRLVEDLKAMSCNPAIHFKTASVGGLAILDQIEGYENVVFVDAIKTAHGKPGSVYEWDVLRFADCGHLSNFHDISFPTAIELGKKIGLSMPKNMTVLAIEIVEDRVFSEGFTPEVESQYETIFSDVKDRVGTLTGQHESFYAK